jgi:hypothetical protein
MMNNLKQKDMPIISTNPIEVDGKVYPNFLVNLSMSPLLGHETVGQSVALKLTPERVEDGVSETLPEHGKSILILDVYKDIEKGDVALQEAVVAISNALQDFINAKGL